MEPAGKCSRETGMILEGRVEVGLGEMAGVARLREKARSVSSRSRDDAGHSVDRGDVGAAAGDRHG